MQKKLINTSPDSRRSNSRRDKRQNIRFKRQNKTNVRRRKQNKNADETLNIIKEILDYNKVVQKNFKLQNQRLKKVLQRG